MTAESRGIRAATGEMDIPTALELFSIAGQINAATDLDFLLEQIGAAAQKILDCEASSIMLVTEDGRSLYFKAASGEKAKAIKTMLLPIGEGIAGRVAQTRAPEVVNDAQSDSRLNRKFDATSGFKTRSLLCVPMLRHGEMVGVVEVLNKRSGSFAEQDVSLLMGLASFVSIAISNAKEISDQKNFFSNVIELLIGIIELSKPGLEGHPVRSARLACAIGRAMKISEYEYRMLYYAGLLHDLGYVAFKNSDAAAGLSTQGSVESMHAEISARMLGGIHMLSGALPYIRRQHERYDGSGFPDGLKGESIPLGARIMGLVESMEDIRMKTGAAGETLYAKALSEAKKGAGSRFDPKAVEAFEEVLTSGVRAW